MTNTKKPDPAINSIISPDTGIASNEPIQAQDHYYDDDTALNRPRTRKDKFSIMSLQLNLPTPQRKGFVRQWVIDKEKRIFDARDWKPVKGEDGNPMRKVMNHNTKEPQFGTYMEIPEVYFQENIEADDSLRRDLMERRIQNKDTVEYVNKDGQKENANTSGGSFYTPNVFGENKIEKNN